MRSLRRLAPWLPPFLALLVAWLLVSGGPAALAEEGGKEPPKEGAEGEPPTTGEDESDPFGDTMDAPTSFSAEKVEGVIRKGVSYLRKQQKPDGSWGPLETENAKSYGGGAQPQGRTRMYDHPAGPTALAVYALLKCQVPLNDPVIKRAFDWLKKNHDLPQGSYETSMLLLAVCATADTMKSTKASMKAKPKLSGTYRGWAQKLVAHLMEKKKGLTWRYQVNSSGTTPGGENDVSSTQLAALALFAAHRLDVRTDAKVWDDIIKFTMDQQDSDGAPVPQIDPVSKKETNWKARGFAYIKGMADPDEGQATGGMTACGVANLMMARFVLSDAGRKQAEWDARPDAKPLQESVQDGLAWLQVNWSPFANPKKDNNNVYHLYWMYAMERAMDLVGNKKVGDHFWYDEMAQHLIRTQDEDGHWDSKSSFGPRDVLDTAFALLFLRRSTKGAIPFPSLTGGSDEAPVDNR